MVVARLPVRQRAARDRQRRSHRRGISRRAPTRLEGEVASHTRKLEALERRGRALRAEIGRKVEELAHEESRVLREAAADAAKRREGARRARARAEKRGARRDAPGRQRRRAAARCRTRRSSSARAPPPRWSRPSASGCRRAKRKQSAREATARDLRRQIEELRGQLSRYAEALEEDLASGREKVAARDARRPRASRRRFSEVTNVLSAHLEGQARVPRSPHGALQLGGDRQRSREPHRAAGRSDPRWSDSLTRVEARSQTNVAAPREPSGAHRATELAASPLTEPAVGVTTSA